MTKTDEPQTRKQSGTGVSPATARKMRMPLLNKKGTVNRALLRFQLIEF
jgi:hypothetical protein